MSPIVVLVAVMIGVTGGIVFLAMDSHEDSISSLDSVSSPTAVYGGVASLPVPLSVEPVARVVNLQVCGSIPYHFCDFAGLSNSDVVVYWEVDNGVGCCHTFGCNYDSFMAFCGSPFSDFKLYDISFDGVKHRWGVPSWEWNYTCSNDTVWNYFVYYDVPIGEHTVTIEQKDCRDVVDVVNISFDVLELEGLYYIGGV